MKTLFTLIALCGALTAFAQIEKGRSYLTGQVSLSDGTQHAESSFDGTVQSSSSHVGSFGANVSYGYLVADNWAIGLNGNSNLSKTSNANFVSKGNGNGLSVYARRYFPVANNFYVHVDAGLSRSTSTSQSKAQTDPEWSKSTSETSSVYLSPGATYFISSRWALTTYLGSVGYSHQKQKNINPISDSINKSDLNTVGFNFGLSSIYFGMSVFF
jgi:hypothetical protein